MSARKLRKKSGRWYAEFSVLSQVAGTLGECVGGKRNDRTRVEE